MKEPDQVNAIGSERLPGLCRVCSQPIAPARASRYPEVTTCITCQRLLENPAVLAGEITRIRKSLALMEKSFTAAMQLGLVEDQTLTAWTQQINDHNRLLSQLEISIEKTG